jgi:hypothetical protein
MELAPYGSRRTWGHVPAPQGNQTWGDLLRVELQAGVTPQVRWAATSFRGQLRRLKREHRARLGSRRRATP